MNQLKIAIHIFYHQIMKNYEKAFNKLSKDKQKFFNEYKDLLKNQYNLVKEKYNPIIKEYITQKDIQEILKKKG